MSEALHRVRHDPETAELLRLWLRLLSATTAIQRELARELRARFGCSLARFDLLAQLARAPAGLTMSELSARLMVTNGNMTGLVRRLEAEGLVARASDASDRRLQRVRLTPCGQELFAEMARAHGAYVRARFAHLTAAERHALSRLLARLRGIVGAPAGEKRDVA